MLYKIDDRNYSYYRWFRYGSNNYTWHTIVQMKLIYKVNKNKQALDIFKRVVSLYKLRDKAMVHDTKMA